LHFAGSSGGQKVAGSNPVGPTNNSRFFGWIKSPFESLVEERLRNSTGLIAVCDIEGRVIGFFSPVKGRPRVDELQLEPPRSISETEERRKKNCSGKPLEKILGRLGF
jgi:hypothetical protein